MKLAILRRLMPGHRLGVLWWLYPDEAHNADGKHVSYLDAPIPWRLRDPKLFDALKEIVAGGKRSVASLEAANLLEGATFYRQGIPTAGDAIERRLARSRWFEQAHATVSDCNLLFLDPDNGLETSRYDAGRNKAGKSVALDELEALRRLGRTIIVYHHQTRMAGGHIFELHHWASQLAERGFTVDALRASAFSARAFFVLDAAPTVRDAAGVMAREWGEKLTWHPRLA